MQVNYNGKYPFSMWNSSNKFQYFKISFNYCTKLNNLPEPVAKKQTKKVCNLSKSLKRENAMEKHI